MNEDVLIHRRAQLEAIAQLRWRLFVNSLHSTRGALELTSRILVAFAFAIGGFGGALGLCVAAYFLIIHGKPQMLALLLWPVFIFWQGFPIMAAAFTDNPDSSDLLRFPLGYSSYFLVRLAYGVFDPATALGSLWLMGILIGVGFAKIALLPWTFVVLLVFAAFNLLFLQMVFAWVERWLAQRRTREILGVLFVLLIVSFQLIGPLATHFDRRARPGTQRFIEVLAPLQGIFPPGLAADSITEGIYPRWPVALSSFALLCAYTIVAGYCLHVRLLKQYRGENLSEVLAASNLPKDRSLRLGWSLPGLSAPVVAVLEKEVRYLLRSGPMLLALIMPMVMLVVFRFGAMNSARRSVPFFTRAPELAFPVAAGYATLMLTNLVYNNFGGDAGGIQLFYACPVRFREVVLGKNLTHVTVLALEVAIAWLAVSVLYRPPSLDVIIATLAALFFAAPLNFTVGNLLSIYSPKKLDYAAFGRQRASQMTVLVSLGVQVFIVGIGVGAFWLARSYNNLWIATVLFLLLGAVSFSTYVIILMRIDGIALAKRETLVAELCRYS